MTYQNQTFDKDLYRQRREQGLSGQVHSVTVFRTVQDEKGNDQLLPIGIRRGPGRSIRLSSGGSSKTPTDPKYTKKRHTRGD